MCDVDGVLHVSGQAIEGAADSLRFLRDRGIVCRFVTNTTSNSRSGLCADLNGMGLPILEDELISAAQAGVLYLQGLKDPRCFFVLQQETLVDYAVFNRDEQTPNTVVIGDFGHDWNFELINKVFRFIMEGADLVTLHKGRYFKVEDGLEIDTGAFIAGLEYASGITATVIGKPQATFFELALATMGVHKDEVIMIGDDLINDVEGAQSIGIPGVLTRTGKYREEVVARSHVKPDGIIESIADLPRLLS